MDEDQGSKPESGPEEEGGVVVPLHLLRDGGGVEKAQAVETRTPFPEDIEPVIRLDASIRDLLVDVGKYETQIIALANQKIAAYNRLKAVQAEQIEAAKKAARRIGIDPDHGAWNLDLVSRIFSRKL